MLRSVSLTGHTPSSLYTCGADSAHLHSSTALYSHESSRRLINLVFLILSRSSVKSLGTLVKVHVSLISKWKLVNTHFTENSLVLQLCTWIIRKSPDLSLCSKEDVLIYFHLQNQLLITSNLTDSVQTFSKHCFGLNVADHSIRPAWWSSPHRKCVYSLVYCPNIEGLGY